MREFPSAGSLVPRAVKVLLEDGIKTFFFKSLSGIGCYRRSFLLERLLNEPIPEIKPQVQVAIGLLKKTEADEYVAFRSKGNLTQIDNNTSRIVDRFDGNHWCFVARHEGEMVSTSWATIQRARIPGLFSEIQMTQEEVYVYDSFTRPDLRGQYISPAIRMEMMRYFRAAGYQRMISLTVPENKPSLRAAQKVGFHPCGMMGYVKIGPWRRNFYRTKRVTIQSDRKLQRWTKVAWWLSGHLPVAAYDILQCRHRYILPFKNLLIPIAILRGSTRANSNYGTLLVAGDEHEIEYMSRRFFEGEPQQELLGKVPLWTLARTLKHLRTSADLTIACIDRLSARIFFGSDYLAVPKWVGSMLTIPEDLTKLVKSSRNLKEDFRIVRRNNLSPEVTHAESDFEIFYHTMYVPFIRNRHGEKGVIHDVHRMRRVFRQGGLLWVIRNGQRASGVLFRQKGQVLRSVAVGTVNGEWIRGKAGTIIATYFFIIEHAKKMGCKLVDFGGSRPSLNDGVLHYKRKWGMKLIDKQNNYYDFLVHWNHFNSSVISFLSNTPLIFRDHGGLSAVYVIDRNQPVTQTEVEKIHRSMWIPGLQQLYLISTSSWQPGVSNPPQTHLVDATTLEDCDPGRLMK